MPNTNTFLFRPCAKQTSKHPLSSSWVKLITFTRRHMRLRFFKTVFLAFTSILLFLFWNINPQVMLILTTLYTMVYLYLFVGYPVVRPFFIGLFLALSYLPFFNHIYDYNIMSIQLFSYPFFPLLAWPLGLTISSYIAFVAIDNFQVRTYVGKLTLSYILFLPLLILVEYGGYHLGNIRLQSNHPPLPFIDCMHIPSTLKAVYFLNGFVFFAILYAFPVNGLARPTRETNISSPLSTHNKKNDCCSCA